MFMPLPANATRLGIPRPRIEGGTIFQAPIPPILQKKWEQISLFKGKFKEWEELGENGGTLGNEPPATEAQHA